jgi:hypothetical protein
MLAEKQPIIRREHTERQLFLDYAGGSIPLLQCHVQIHRVAAVGLVERLQLRVADSEPQGGGVARDGLADVRRVQRHGTPAGSGA